MTFAGINYVAILVAAVAGWLTGAVWYGAPGKPWMAALGRPPEECKQNPGTPASYVPFGLAFVPALTLSWFPPGLLAHLGGPDAIGLDMVLTDTQPAGATGSDWKAAPRLDNLGACHSALQALQDAEAGRHTAMLVANDHEEVGSGSADPQGSSTFLVSPRPIVSAIVS